MIEAWFRASEITASSGPRRVFEHAAAVGVEAGGVEDRVLLAEERGEPGLQFLVHLLGAADEAHGRHAVAPAVQRLVGGGDDRADGRRGRGSCWRRS